MVKDVQALAGSGLSRQNGSRKSLIRDIREYG